MNFFERQRAVRAVSARLVWLFVFAVVGIVAVIDLAAWFSFQLSEKPVGTAVGVLVAVSGVTIALIGITSWVKTLLLRRGGGAQVAESLGGQEVPGDTVDPDLRRYRNVVEEIAIASGTPVPRLYVLPDEPGINAFAAGYSPADAAIAVTAGTLRHLNRDELQGVIAHEFSHIVNGDMRLNIRIIGVLAGIVGLAVVGRVLLSSSGQSRSSNQRKGGGNPLVLVGLAAFLAGYIGVFVGRLIKAAVSRQREYLADASAVQFTRQTEGIAGALKKIGGIPTGSELRSGKGENVSHMLFGAGKKFSSLYATHPPLAKRIQQLDPAFNPAELEHLSQQWAHQPPSGLAEDQALGLAGSSGSGSAPAGGDRVAARPEDIVAAVGNPAAGSFQSAEALLAQVPHSIRDRIRRPESVVPLVYGLLLSADPEVRHRQHQLLTELHGKATADAAWREGGELAQLGAELRLPITELTLPGLRAQHTQHARAILHVIQQLIAADGQISVYEYCISTLLHRDLYEAEHRMPPWGNRRSTLSRSQDAVAATLATLAATGNSDSRAAEAAYYAGLAQVLPSVNIPFAPPEQGPVALDAAWPALDGLPAAEKQRLITGLTTVIAHDGTLTLAESELLRTICSMVHCPVPPLIDVPAAEPSPDSGSRLGS